MKIMIASPLEAELVERVRTAADVDEVLYAPELLERPRYPNDHAGEPVVRDASGEVRWEAMLARADVLFGYPGESSAGLAHALDIGRAVRFVQGTSAGMGAHVKRARLAPEILSRVAFASAAGVHAGMLAEYCFYGLLTLRKDAKRLEQIRIERAWEHYAMGELDGSSLAILGMGQIGTAIARRARAFGMTVVGITRSGNDHPDIDEAQPTTALEDVARRVDALVLTLPITDATAGMVSERIINALRPHAIVVNVGRGGVVDEPALIAALIDGRLAGAVLDVFAREPLPVENPLWTLPNVVMSPHTAALSLYENERIIALFLENLRRLRNGVALKNALNLSEFY